jgi:ubiquinone/menaquinone biosynthesis C-methylase UbiE
MLERTLEPEVMDDKAEAEEYDTMDHEAVNSAFVEDFLTACKSGSTDSPTSAVTSAIPITDVLDVGTGTALIPIELCQRDPDIRVMASDFSPAMLDLAVYRLEVASLRNRIQLHHADAKHLGFDDNYFDAVISNSLVHHIGEPAQLLQQCWRVVKPGGMLFVRDLSRPNSDGEVDKIVTRVAANESETSRQLLHQSLHAALTVAEIQELCEPIGIPKESVSQTSDRHWTIAARKKV